MFMRFAVTEIDEDSRRPRGVFAASYALLESGRLGAEEERRLREVLRWFEDYLPSPDCFDRRRAVFWFKAGAGEMLRRAWELVWLLRLHGLHVELYKCRRLANVLYEDREQVAAFSSPRDGRVTR